MNLHEHIFLRQTYLVKEKLSVGTRPVQMDNIYINPGMTLTYYYSKVNKGRLCILKGKIVEMGFEGQNLQEMGK